MRAQVLLGEGDKVLELRLERLHLDIVRVLGETQLDLRELVLCVRTEQGRAQSMGKNGVQVIARLRRIGKRSETTPGIGNEVEQVGSESAGPSCSGSQKHSHPYLIRFEFLLVHPCNEVESREVKGERLSSSPSWSAGCRFA